MAYQIDATPVTLSNLQSHSPTARLFKCDFLCGSWQDFIWRSVWVPLLYRSFFFSSGFS